MSKRLKSCSIIGKGRIRELQHTIERRLFYAKQRDTSKDILVETDLETTDGQAVPNLEEVERQAIGRVNLAK